MDSQVDLGRREIQDRKEVKDLPGLRDPLGQQDNLAAWDPRDRLEIQGPQDRRVAWEQLVTPDLQGLPDHLALQDCRDHLELAELLVLKDPTGVPERLDSPVHPDPAEVQDLPDLSATSELRVVLDSREPLVHRVHLEVGAILVIPEWLDQTVPPEIRALQDRKDP